MLYHLLEQVYNFPLIGNVGYTVYFKYLAEIVTDTLFHETNILLSTHDQIRPALFYKYSHGCLMQR